MAIPAQASSPSAGTEVDGSRRKAHHGSVVVDARMRVGQSTTAVTPIPNTSLLQVQVGRGGRAACHGSSGRSPESQSLGRHTSYRRSSDGVTQSAVVSIPTPIPSWSGRADARDNQGRTGSAEAGRAAVRSTTGNSNSVSSRGGVTTGSRRTSESTWQSPVPSQAGGDGVRVDSSYVGDAAMGTRRGRVAVAVTTNRGRAPDAMTAAQPRVQGFRGSIVDWSRAGSEVEDSNDIGRRGSLEFVM